MKRLLIPLIAASVAIGGAAPVPTTYVICIYGKTKNTELWLTGNPEWLIKNIGLLSEAKHGHSWTGAYAAGGAFSGDGAPGRIIGRGKSTLPPNSPIGAFRNASLDFVEGILFEQEHNIKRNSKLVIKNDELRKDGTYVAVIEQTTLGYHQ